MEIKKAGIVVAAATALFASSLCFAADTTMVTCKGTDGKESKMTRDDCKKSGGMEMVKCKDSSGKTSMMTMEDCTKKGGTEVKE